MCGFFIRIIVTYAYIFFSGRSKVSHGTSSQLTGMLPYRSVLNKTKPIVSATCLIPDYYPPAVARLVSCYALFK